MQQLDGINRDIHKPYPTNMQMKNSWGEFNKTNKELSFNENQSKIHELCYGIFMLNYK